MVPLGSRVVVQSWPVGGQNELGSSVAPPIRRLGGSVDDDAPGLPTDEPPSALVLGLVPPDEVPPEEVPPLAEPPDPEALPPPVAEDPPGHAPPAPAPLEHAAK